MRTYVAAGLLTVVAGCSQPAERPVCPVPPVSLEGRLLPSAESRQAMLDAVQLVKVKRTYAVVEELFDPVKKEWQPLGLEKREVDERFGSGAVVGVKDGYSYVLTAAHVVDFEKRAVVRPLFESLRRQERLVNTEVNVVVGYGKNEGVVFEKQLSGEVVVLSKLDMALVRVKDKLSVGVHEFREVDVGDPVFCVGFVFIPALDRQYLSSNERMLKMFNVGFVKSLGDPLDASDDHLLYVNMNTQPGNSGGPVFTQDMALAGMNVHTLAGGGAQYQGIVNAKTIQKFLKENGL